jgi:ABC-2 type transport system ATP-binding protein
MTETHQPTTMLRTTGLTKRYGARVALGDLSLSLQSGQFVALLGPNGAGKSTLFQVLTGLFAADEGEVEVAGHSLARSATAALRHIGVVFQQVSLDLDLSVRRNLLFQADLHGLPRRLAAARIEAGCSRLGIGADLDRKARELSGGNRRKVELVRATLHRPSVLLMDEATVGLDPKSRQDLLRALQADVRERGVCVLWATHWVEEALDADRVLVLHNGSLLADGTPAQVTRALGEPTLEAGFIARTSGAAAPRQPKETTPS